MNRKQVSRTGPFATIEAALQAIRAGSMVVVMDDEDRENEGDFVMAAEKVTAEDVNLMTREARGLLCVSMPGGRVRRRVTPDPVGAVEFPRVVEDRWKRGAPVEH